MSGTLHEYLWIAIAGGIFGFAYNFGIGANDVANAFVSCLIIAVISIISYRLFLPNCYIVYIYHIGNIGSI